MKKWILSVFIFIGLVTAFQGFVQAAPADGKATVTAAAVSVQEEHGDDAHHGKEPAGWSVIPFVLLLLMIATGPLFYPHFWHKRYPIIAIILGVVVVCYYLFILENTHNPIHSLAEYVSFIALIASLYIASGGILIKVDKEGTPIVNVAMLVIGAVIANVIGTTGASMLLIRPFVRLNKNRIKPYHIVFFIFIVSNVGGSLTPIGDPPLFLGFLKGVPFFWTLTHLWIIWAFGIACLCLIFFLIDRKNHADYYDPEAKSEYTGAISIDGKSNILWLAVIIGAVFLDPNVLNWVPAIETADGTKFSYLREAIMFAVCFLSYKTAKKECLKGNEFNFEPIKEVGFLFIGIFATMMPALHLISSFANSPAGQQLVTVDSLFWSTGILSGILDNAPTYLNFLAAGMGKFGLDINQKADVIQFSSEYAVELMSISIASVFFGALTYIGNAPNFMVKSIAEQIGIEMPSFVGYVFRFSLLFLMPVLILTWLVFFFLV